MYPYNLRWVLFFTALVGIIWALAMGVQQIQNRSSSNSQLVPSHDLPVNGYQTDDDTGPTKLQVFDIVTAILYLVIAVLEFYALITAALVSLSSRSNETKITQIAQCEIGQTATCDCAYRRRRLDWHADSHDHHTFLDEGGRERAKPGGEG